MAMFICRVCGGQPCFYEDPNPNTSGVDVITCTQHTFVPEWQQVECHVNLWPLVEVCLKTFDFEKEMSGLDKEDSPEVTQLRILAAVLR